MKNLCAEMIMPTNYIIFKEDGTFTESPYMGEPSDLTSFMYSRSTGMWFKVDFPTGSLNISWVRAIEEEVPSGIRLMCMLIK